MQDSGYDENDDDSDDNFDDYQARARQSFIDSTRSNVVEKNLKEAQLPGYDDSNNNFHDYQTRAPR